MRLQLPFPPFPPNKRDSVRENVNVYLLLRIVVRHPDPRKRPNFEDVNNHLDIILIHAAIYDEQVTFPFSFSFLSFSSAH